MPDYYSADTQMGHLEGDCPITTFSETKDFQGFFANRPIKFNKTMCPLKTLKAFELT